MLSLFALVLACHGPVDRHTPTLSVAASAVASQWPLPVTVLETAAGDLDPSVRAAALSALITFSTRAGGGPWGARATWDPNPWVQRRALEALGSRLPEADSHALIVGVLGRPEVDAYTRGLAAFLLARSPTDTDATAVHAAWAGLGDTWQAASPALAGAMMGDDAAHQQVARALREGTLPLDLEFLKDVGNSGLVTLIPPLRDALDVVEPELRLAVAGALVALGDDRGAAVLADALVDPQQQLAAIDVVVEVPDGRGLFLLDRVARGPDGLASSYAQMALAAHQGHSSDPFVLAAASLDRERRSLAMRFVGVARATGEAPHSRKWARAAHVVVLTGMADPEPTVREAAARAGAPTEEEALRALLLDDDGAVRVAAADRLCAIRPAPAPTGEDSG